MAEKYDLAKLLKEIEEDETTNQQDNRILSQDAIQKMMREKKQSKQDKK